MSGPSFRFRLERVRALRERKEDAAKQELAVAMTAHRRCEEELQAAADRVARARSAQLDAGSTATSATELQSRQAYLERTERALDASRYDLDRHELELEQRREALTDAARDRQALERLKEQRRADHERELVRREGLVLDEIAITNFRRATAA
jgi:flagellar protein FliJ